MPIRIIFVCLMLGIFALGCAQQGQSQQQRQERVLSSQPAIDERDILEKDGESVYENSSREAW